MDKARKAIRMEAEIEDLWKDDPAFDPEFNTTIYQVHTYPREGRDPVFVVRESLNNQGPSLSSVREGTATVKMLKHGIKPEDMQWYEQDKDGNWTKVTFKTTKIDEKGKPIELRSVKEERLKDETQVEAAIAKGIIEPRREPKLEIETKEQYRQRKADEEWKGLGAPKQGEEISEEHKQAEKQKQGYKR
jgi:hypothetical protein